jgi:hypothetical protein
MLVSRRHSSQHTDIARLVKAISAIVSHMAEGEITPDEAATAASVIETKRKALKTEELDRRLTALEQQLSTKRKTKWPL